MFKKFLFIFHFVYKQAGTNYVLREYRSKEKKQELLKVNIYFWFETSLDRNNYLLKSKSVDFQLMERVELL